MENPFLGPCHCDREGEPGAGGGCGAKEIVIAEELAALAAIRALSARARAIRAELAACRSSTRQRELAEALEAARAELARCRQAWSAANDLKLRRLGHRP